MHGREGILKFRYGSVPTRDQGLDGRILNRVYKNRVGSNGLVNALLNIGTRGGLL